MSRRHPWIITVAVLWAAVGLEGGRVWGDEMQVNTYTTDFQRRPAVTINPNGDSVVVWMSDQASGDPDFSIRGQRFAPDGSPVSEEFQINTYTTSGQYRPAVASDSAGNFVVVWNSYSAPGDLFLDSIQGQRFASDGSPMGEQFQVNTTTPGYQTSPALAFDAEGDFVVVWDSYLYDYNLPVHSIYGRRYASDGTPVGDDFRINTPTSPRTRAAASVASSAVGDFVVVWHSFGAPNGDPSGSIQGRRYASDGTPLGEQFQVETLTDDRQWLPSVASSPAGDFVAVWESRGSYGTDSAIESIQGQRYASDGSRVGEQFQINTYTPNEQGQPSVAMDAAGNFAVAWTSDGSSGSDLLDDSVQAQFFSADGKRLAGEFRVNALTLGDQGQPAVALGATGELTVVWTSDVSSGTDSSETSVQRTSVQLIFADGFESGDTSAWSSSLR